MTTQTPIRSQNVDDTIARLIADGREIGVQVTAYLDGKKVVDSWGGLADPATGRMVDGDTLFNMFSVTKPMAATALHIQVARGLVDYDARVADYWPEYAVNGKEATTVRDVLTHRAGIPQMPEGVTPELMCDWDWMTSGIANLTPLAPPGEKALYLSMTFGWLVGEIVRRTDPAHRDIGTFIREEIALPLDAPDIWVGLPDDQFPRVARLTNAMPPVPPEFLPPLYTASMPPQVDLVPEVFERPDVRRAPIAGVGGIFTTRSCARFWSMIAQGGELDGVRILPADLVATFNTPRPFSDEPDPVMFGMPVPLGIAGFWLGGENPPVAAAKYPRALCHPGAGNSIGFADPETRLAVAITHNRMQAPRAREDDTALIIADAIRADLGMD
ncbi:serine hydrolase domain-containing protein [Sphingobium sp. HBC34]|uniref:Serine hydrolase domain-containing protein n=1 Tax=Sphingobium cyanobacteriorum TaxID=3063954 RepID=A0ABT8ZG00_9SPHN|nr:serine hydrolase domain-containing protein [Sphingobium sp. HBC34]MDO7833464.1 serine hydrolase domain-containing protein [Sphingobium sp. HBC34]